MIDDMASLKKAMAEMDAQDLEASQAGKEHAAQILSRARSSFSNMAELIEQRRLLLRPKILASIKRMDQPEMLGDAAFRDAGIALRREGQSFRQIAEAIELNGKASPQRESTVRTAEPLRDRASLPGAPKWVDAANVALRIIFFPLRHPVRFLTIALLAVLLFNALRGVSLPQQISGFVDGVAGVRQHADAVVNSILDKRSAPPPEATEAKPIPPAPVPSPPPTPPSPSFAEGTTDSAGASAPPVIKVRPETKGTSSQSAAADGTQAAYPRFFRGLMPLELRRKSAGRCIGGTGGCFWGGRQF